MSITKGAMLISNANAVGAELVNKLGGTGYKPVEWANAINLLGISNDDKVSALAGITEGTYTGDERGSIKYSNCNAVGSMLNKKFSTDRGFKPVEWESAISKLTPLAERTVSGSVVSFPNGADDVPTKSLIVTIPPTLSGVSSVTETQTGVNIWNEQWEVGGLNTSTGADSTQTDRIRSVGFIRVQPSTQYYFYNGTDIASQSNINIVVCCYDQNKQYTGSYYYRNKTQPTLSNPADSYYIRFYCVAGYGVTYNNDISINYPATDTDYHSYNGTTYTASLGRTIYGGTADVVNGTGTEGYNKITLSSLLTDLNITQIGTTGVYRIRFSLADAKGAINSAVFNGLCDYYTPITANQTYAQNEGISINTSGQCYIYDSRFNASTSLNDFKTWIDANPVNLCYELATPADFTFTGQKIPTRLGYNVFWSDDGDTEVTYRKDPDIPDQPVQLLDMNNNENNDN